MQTNIFTPKVDQIFDDPKESLLRVKNYHLLYEFDVEK